MKLLRRIEVLCVIVATCGAIATLSAFDVLPIDRIGVFADLGAGFIAAVHLLRGRNRHHP